LRDSEVAVSYGAVLRAYSKENGPASIPKLSYGFGITEMYDPETHEAHAEVLRPYIDKLDGIKYVQNTIEWLVCIPRKVAKNGIIRLINCHQLLKFG